MQRRKWTPNRSTPDPIDKRRSVCPQQPGTQPLYLKNDSRTQLIPGPQQPNVV